MNERRQRKKTIIDEEQRLIDKDEQLAKRMDDRKKVRANIYSLIDNAIAVGTPEERAIAILRHDTEGSVVLAQLKRKVCFVATREEEELITKYIKLHHQLDLVVRRLYTEIKAYETEIGYLATLIDKLEAIPNDLVMNAMLYGELVKAKADGGETHMGYKIGREEINLDAITPEALLEEINATYQKDGVRYLPNIKKLQRGTIYKKHGVEIFGVVNTDGSAPLIADLNFEGGLFDKLREQAEDSAKFLARIKGYAEAIKKFATINNYDLFLPSAFYRFVESIEREIYSRDIIAADFHCSYLNDKRAAGETITPREEQEAFVPDYREVMADKATKRYATNMIKILRNGE